MTFGRITTDPNVMKGQPCIRGLRIPVATVVVMVADGMSPAEVVTELPDLEYEDVAEALHYAAAAVRGRARPVGPAAAKAAAAAQHAEAVAAADELVAEYERDFGPIPEEVRRRNREFLREIGLREDDSAEGHR